MARNIATNNASTTLASAITSSATTITVTAGGGASFPHPVSPQYFRFTIVKNGNPALFEIGKCIGYPSSDTFTVVRGQEGTTAQSWSAGDYFNLLFTAGDFGDAVQADDLQAQLGNYSLDVGTANNYSATFSPAITSHIQGAPLRVKIANTNTSSTVTFNDGAGVGNVYLPGGASVSAGSILALSIATFVWDGSGFQLVNSPTNVSGIEQTIIDLIYPVGAYVYWENDNLNPNTQFPWQTWAELATGQVLVSRNPGDANFSSTGQTGGEETHTLVAGEIPPLPFQDGYYSEDLNIAQSIPGAQFFNIGGLNNSIGSQSTDYNNSAVFYRNASTLSGNGSGGANPHNNLQPYRVVRVWRRTA